VPVPPGDYRRVQNTGADKCLRGRAAPGLNAPVNVCAADGVVVRITAGPLSADGFDWFNAQDVGWVAGRQQDNGATFLAAVGTPPGPARQFACMQLTLRTTTPGTLPAPATLSFTVDRFDGAWFTSTSGQASGHVFGGDLYLQYDVPVNGRTATGTIVGQLLSTGQVRGQFVDTAFQGGTTGAEGSVSGTAGSRPADCGGR
jgi:hypothetical protein